MKDVAFAASWWITVHLSNFGLLLTLCSWQSSRRCKIFIPDHQPTVYSASKVVVFKSGFFLLLSAELSLPYVLTPWEVRSK